jgi:hypothetical protein
MELATLLRMEVNALPDIAAEFPVAVAPDTLDKLRDDKHINVALERRQDLRGLAGRVESAGLRARMAERDVESRINITLGQDRMLLNWQSPLGENRRSGARQQATADVRAAEDAVEEQRRRARQEIQLGVERLATSARTLSRASAVAAELRERMGLVRSLVEAGRQSPLTLNDVADQYATVRRQRIEAQLQHAIALADLRKSTATIPDNLTNPSELARLFVTVPSQ